MAYIFNQNGNGVGILESYNSIKWSRNYYKSGAIELKINNNQFNAELIQIGRLIIPNEYDNNLNQIYIIEQTESRIDESGKENESLIVTGRSIGGMFEERLGLPPTGSAYDDRSGPAESLMKYWVNQNTAAGALVSRKIPNLVVTADEGKGGNVSYSLRYQTIAKMLEDIGKINNIGWEVTYNIDTNNYEFDVILPTDKTEGSSSPVFFDIDFETILGSSLLSSKLEEKTFAYIGGIGEGATRTITTTFLTSAIPTGFNRKELWVDAGNLSSLADLRREGEINLQKTQPEDKVQVDINNLGSFEYKTDWDLGNIVTFQNKNWNYKLDIQIIGVSVEINNSLSEPIISVELGDTYPTIKSRVDNAIGDKTRERL